MKTLLKILVFLVISLIVLGTILVFSASSTESLVKYESFFHLFRNHLSKVIIAIMAMVVFAFIPYSFWQKYSKYGLLLAVLLLALTPIIGMDLKGAKRWIDLGIFSFQPAELAKFMLLLHLSSLIVKKGELIKDFKKGFAYLLFWVYVVSALIIIQPNVSTAMIIMLLSFILFFAAGARIRHIGATIFTSLALGAIPMLLFSHSRSRILTFINNFKEGAGESYQMLQAKIALGSGGFFGVGIGESRQSDFFLPEPYGDFIFSILGEETGFLGAVVVLLIYLTIFAIGLIIAFKAKDEFGKLAAFALSFNIIFSAFLNAAVVTGVVPTTGITLPFISFGGTSLIVFCMSVGILLNIGYKAANNKTLSTEQI